MSKDLGLAKQAIEEAKISINYGIQSLEKFQQLVEKGEGNLDFSNVINH